MITRQERAERREALPEMPETLTTAVLNEREVIGQYKRHRRELLDSLTKPARVHTDAACGHGIATLSYTSDALGERVEVIRCENSTRAELLALLMAMNDAEQSALPGFIEYRLDCTAVANYTTMRTASFRSLRRTLHAMLQAHSNWRLLLIPRSENRIASNLARKALEKWVRGR